MYILKKIYNDKIQICDIGKLLNLRVLSKSMRSIIFNLLPAVPLKIFYVSWKYLLGVSNIQFSFGKIGNNFMKIVFRKYQLNNRFKCRTQYFMVFKTKKKKNLWLNPLTKQAQDTKYLELNINSKHHITSQNDISLWNKPK